jgi:hypothetical protein
VCVIGGNKYSSDGNSTICRYTDNKTHKHGRTAPSQNP